MAAGAILPPMFFERRLVSQLAPRMACSGTPLKQHQRHQRNSTAGVIRQATRDKSLPKEI
jgi:hypothetical protein